MADVSKTRTKTERSGGKKNQNLADSFRNEVFNPPLLNPVESQWQHLIQPPPPESKLSIAPQTERGVQRVPSGPVVVIWDGVPFPP